MKIKKVVHHGKIRWRVNDPRGVNGKRQRKFLDVDALWFEAFQAVFS